MKSGADEVGATCPFLFIFSGLPGTGKSTLAKSLAHRTRSAYLRIDTIEQALRELCALDVQEEGYRLAYRIAADQLHLGMSVVADSCNPVAASRRAWQCVAADAGVSYVNVEVTCSDEREHRRRIESRESQVEGLKLPTWADVQRREYHPWQGERIVVDTAGRTIGEAQVQLREELTSYTGVPYNLSPTDHRQHIKENE